MMQHVLKQQIDLILIKYYSSEITSSVELHFQILINLFYSPEVVYKDISFVHLSAL
jgi:hypothetical protein